MYITLIINVWTFDYLLGGTKVPIINSSYLFLSSLSLEFRAIPVTFQFIITTSCAEKVKFPRVLLDLLLPPSLSKQFDDRTSLCIE
jgi:hypothetical protein